MLKFVNELELDFSIGENKALMLEALAKIDLLKGKDYPIVINGEKIFTERKIQTVNPAKKEEILGYASSADISAAELAVNAAYEAFKTWRYVAVSERIGYIKRLTELLKKKRLEFAAWMIEESGKNYGEADGEICEAIDFFNAYCMEMEELDKGLELVESPDELRKCSYIPIGVGLAIPPWNFPFSLVAGMVAGAIITGNTVIIKPASDTPIVAYKLMELLEECNIPKGVVNFLSGSGGEIGDYIVKHPKTRFVNFTGSKEVGLRISRLAAETSPKQIWIKRVIAEMGGKNATIVDSSANLKKAAEGIVAAAFSYQGQKCSACSRALVMADVYDELVEEVKTLAERLVMGEGRKDYQVGPVISKRAYDGIVRYIEVGKTEGNLLCGGTYDDSTGFFIKPTVIKDVSRDAVIANEEIFGPVLAVIKVNTFDEAIEIANSTEYGLTGAVYSQDKNNIEKARQEFFVGNLYINRKSTGAVVKQHPFGGFNMSGTDAKTGTKDYLQNFMQLKSVAENISL